VQRAQLEQVIDRTPGLAAVMREFGYAAPAAFEIDKELPGRRGARALGRRLRKAVKRSLRSRPSRAAVESGANAKLPGSPKPRTFCA
jgi:hypothetical protein